MNIQARVKLLISLFVLAYSSGASAVLLNPLPGLYGADDGSESFMPSGSLAISIEMADPFNGEFGFYYESDPTELIRIFDVFDFTDDNGPAVAAIDFTAGIIADVDQAGLQGLFTPEAGAIGFYLAFIPDSISGLLTNPIYTNSALNVGSLDLAAAFPSLTDPQSYLLGFESIILSSDLTPIVIPMAFEAVAGISKIPEPTSIVLLLLGLLGVALERKRQNNRASF